MSGTKSNTHDIFHNKWLHRRTLSFGTQGTSDLHFYAKYPYGVIKKSELVLISYTSWKKDLDVGFEIQE